MHPHRVLGLLLEVPADTRGGNGKHRPVGELHVLETGVEEAEDADPQPPPRPGRHQNRVPDVDAPVRQVTLDQAPLVKQGTPRQDALLGLGLRRVVDPPFEPFTVAGLAGICCSVAPLTGADDSPGRVILAAASSPIAKWMNRYLLSR